ncbi:MAG: beta-lactamase family protein [Planctomycetes bacterium]|nr:beta-lactamase family protein [Planctomycetota bacterium]
MRRRILLLLALLVGTLPVALLADDFKVAEDDSLKKIAADTRKKFNVPGICIALLDGNRSVRIAAAGVRKAGDKEAMTAQDLCHIGSCTKAMTATMVACVIKDTKLEWESTVADILPDIAKKAHADYQKVTVRQLVNHTAGLPASSKLLDMTNEKVSRTQNRRILFTKLLTEEPKSKPGEKYVYSNLGFMLAGLMAETVADSSWRELMQKYLFKPLEMKNTGFGWPGTKDKVEQPWGHTSFFGLAKPIQHDNPEVLGPAGRVHCPVSDWARFASLHLGHIPDGMKLTKADLKKMLKDPLNNYSGGWIHLERPWAGGKALMHNGSNTMWYAVIWVAPEIDQAFLAVTNTGKSNAFQACDAAISAMIIAEKQAAAKGK